MNNQRISGCRTVHRNSFYRVLVSAQVGRYTVEVYNDCHDEPVYRVCVGDRELRCWTDYEEQHFPKTAARTGTWLVAVVKGKKAAPEGA